MSQSSEVVPYPQVPVLPLSVYASLEANFSLNQFNASRLRHDLDAYSVHAHLSTASGYVQAKEYRQQSLVPSISANILRVAAEQMEKLIMAEDTALLKRIYDGRYTQLDVIVGLIDLNGQLVPRRFRIGKNPSSPMLLDLRQYVQFDARHPAVSGLRIDL
ncbi:MAG: hypothetical protein WC596_03890 [Candidatus Shapirobacteria bacterium]